MIGSSKKHLRVLAFLTCVAAIAPLAEAQLTTTVPVGVVKTQCLGNSDTLVGLTLTRPVAFTGVVGSVSGNVITVSGTPGFTANQFVYAAGSQTNTYYVELGSATSSANPREGAIYAVTANGTSTLTVNLSGDTLSSVPAGSRLTIIPYWTLNTVFPTADANTSFLTSSNVFVRNTEIIIPNYSGTGTDVGSSATYFYLNSGWRLFGDQTSVDHGDDVLLPAGYFRQRNNLSTTTTLTTVGAVEVQKIALPLATLVNGKQDNAVSLIRPVPVALNDLGLISGGAFVASTSFFNRADELLVYDNTAVATLKAPSITYFYYNSAWRKFGSDLSTDFGTDTIPVGSALTIRKAATADGLSKLWANAATY